MTTAIVISLISLGVSILALFFNISKFFIELYDRKQKKKSEEEVKMKADLKVSLDKPNLVIQNVGNCDANIKEIWLDGRTWDESGLFIVDRPSIINANQPPRMFKIAASFDNPYPKHVNIQYADSYSRQHMEKMHDKEYQI